MQAQDSGFAIPRLPGLFSASLRPLPLGPLSLALTVLTRRIARRHPQLFRRLGEHRRKRFLLAPTDLPFALLLDLSGPEVKVTVSRGEPPADSRLTGSLAAFLGMVHGAYDGDALFFSRDLAVSGDTAAALALRNAMDDAELDLSLEATALVGPLRAPLDRFLDFAEQRSGVALRRAQRAMIPGEWE